MAGTEEEAEDDDEAIGMTVYMMNDERICAIHTHTMKAYDKPLEKESIAAKVA